ncbi:HipA domain-containing protein [Beggiatoa alba]|nr:HipA domain-containing protein [Beggiatoa alba]
MELKQQESHQAVDVSGWGADDEFVVYPEGARVKSRLDCPGDTGHAFLIADHHYMFKHSRDRYPEQYWVEILAYRLGVEIGVPVPPTFVAFDSDNGKPGALIEWFYKTSGEVMEGYVQGGDYRQRIIPEYDRKEGKQHNFETITTICKALKQYANLADNWLEYWSKVLIFDALLGNTDRHHDNWGVIFSRRASEEEIELRMSPAFDNGTSMGHEILPEKFAAFSNPPRTERYVARGKHHMKWRLSDAGRINHGVFLQEFVAKYPQARGWMLKCLGTKSDVLSAIVNKLTEFDVPVPLSPERAEFMSSLLIYRNNYLKALLAA